MYWQKVVFFVLISTVILVKADDDCPVSDRSNHAPIRLRKHLLCDYDKNTRPIKNHKAAVPIMIQMITKYFDYDMHENSFSVDSWMAMSWMDEFLVWNPDDYESISKIHLSDSDIWMPDISVYNRRNQGGDQALVESVTCIVTNNGKVVCVPSVSHSTICTSDLSKYPFDTHNCTIRIGSWVHSGEEIDIQIPKVSISTQDLVPNGEWELVKTYTIKHAGKYKCCPNSTYPSINFSFKIQRKSGAHAASIILPAIALIILTLASLWVAPNNPQRLQLCFVNVISEFINLQYVSWMIPLNGDNIPLIRISILIYSFFSIYHLLVVLFARDSLLLSVFTVVLSLVLKSLVEDETPPSTWISKVVCILVAFKPGQFIFLKNSNFKGFNNEDDVSAIINSPEPEARKTERLIFAKILDRLCFIIFVIMYVCMFVAFTP